MPSSLQHETSTGTVQSSKPSVYPPPPQTIGILAAPSLAAPSVPPPSPPPNAAPTGVTERNRKSSWDPSMPHARQHSPDIDHRRGQIPNTPYISSRMILPSRSSGDTDDDDTGLTERRNTGVSWGTANYQSNPTENTIRNNSFSPSAHRMINQGNRQNSWDPPVPNFQPYPSYIDSRRVQNPSNPFIPPLPSVIASPRYNPNDNAGVTESRTSGPAWSKATQVAMTPNIGMASLYDASLPSAHPTGNPSWSVDVYSQRLQVTGERLRGYQMTRLALRFESQLNDLFAGSLVPLTQQHRPHELEKITDQATVFFSSFHSNAHWYTDVENLPHRVGKVIDGLTANSRNSDLGFRFMRFRFPYITFEWFLQTPYCEIYAKMHRNGYQPTEVEVLWKAWARAGAASGLVAYGSIKDTIQIVVVGPNEWERIMLITDRHFIVTQVFQPELMTPVPYHRELPPLSR
ncbi:hypothetical protein GALMADRAFT_221036 [Galerina marginata CBS 339.88]|uniref:Uncharacterized protein n=1 Tax=Galerina marginata (strain CBS 339.88) TaxID=685588 RepID=A0A067TIL6_GALM3|nr:hypothetical protein GALMADRAFT_221036 [Galerina marginata CBS 339.88]